MGVRFRWRFSMLVSRSSFWSRTKNYRIWEEWRKCRLMLATESVIMATMQSAMSASITTIVRTMIHKISRPVGLTNSPANIIPYLPDEDCRVAGTGHGGVRRGTSIFSHDTHQCQQPAVLEIVRGWMTRRWKTECYKIDFMYKRSIKPIQQFLESPPPEGVYIIDTQFGKINYVSGEVSLVISTRIDANGAYYVIEIYEQEKWSYCVQVDA